MEAFWVFLFIWLGFNIIYWVVFAVLRELNYKRAVAKADNDQKKYDGLE